MNALFGACIGAVIGNLIKHEEYFFAVLAAIALAIYLYTFFH